MHKIMAEIEGFNCNKKTLNDWLTAEIAEGPKGCCLEAAGDITDMIKDLAEAEEKCMKKKYYEMCIYMMMQEMKEEDHESDEKYGYDNWHYPSSGRFAPKGSGRKYGYSPDWDDDGKMGYPMNKMMDMRDMPSEYGRAYDEYKMAKRHYTESKSDTDNKEMNRKIEENGVKWLETMEEMLKDANPELRKKLKMQTTKLFEQMA